MTTPSPDPQQPRWQSQGSPHPYGQPNPAGQGYPPNQPFPLGSPPAQPPYPPGPPYPPSQPSPLGGAPKSRKKKGRVWLVVLGVFVALVVIGSLAGKGGDSSTTTATDSGQSQGTGSGAQDGGSGGSQGGAGQAAAARIGAEVRDGDFAFVVTKVETGVHQLGSGAWSTKAQGEFVLVRVTVTNVGNEAAMFSGSSQKLFDDAGRTFEADSGSAVMYIPDSESFLNNINPGNTVKATVVFDVPAGLKPAAIELHDSPFSGGATVSLR